MNITQPIYFLSINIVNCNAEIWCNDVILFDFQPLSTNNQGIALTIPINHLILKQGEFEIRAAVKPSFRKEKLSKSSFVVLELSVKSNNSNNDGINLLRLKTPHPSDAIDKKEPIKINDIKTLENLKSYDLIGLYKDKLLPYDEIGWMQSANLLDKDPQNLLSKGYDFFKNIESIINNNLIHQFIELNEDKNRLIKETLYLTNKQYEKCKIDDVILLINGGYKLVPINFNDIEYVIMGKGRLLKLRRKNGLALILLNNPQKQSTAEFDIKLHKKTATSDFSII